MAVGKSVNTVEDIIHEFSVLTLQNDRSFPVPFVIEMEIASEVACHKAARVCLPVPASWLRGPSRNC